MPGLNRGVGRLGQLHLVALAALASPVTPSRCGHVEILPLLVFMPDECIDSYESSNTLGCHCFNQIPTDQLIGCSYAAGDEPARLLSDIVATCLEAAPVRRSTVPLITDPPAHAASTTDDPATDDPASAGLATEGPITEEPAPDRTTTEEPPTDEPATEGHIAVPTALPTPPHTSLPTNQPTSAPSAGPTLVPTEFPTGPPTRLPSLLPTELPTDAPSAGQEPTTGHTRGPTSQPSDAAVGPKPSCSPEETLSLLGYMSGQCQQSALEELLSGHPRSFDEACPCYNQVPTSVYPQCALFADLHHPNLDLFYFCRYVWEPSAAAVSASPTPEPTLNPMLPTSPLPSVEPTARKLTEAPTDTPTTAAPTTGEPAASPTAVDCAAGGRFVGPGGCRGPRGRNVFSFKRGRASSLQSCVAECAKEPKCTGVEYAARRLRGINCQLQRVVPMSSAGGRSLFSCWAIDRSCSHEGNHGADHDGANGDGEIDDGAVDGGAVDGGAVDDGANGDVAINDDANGDDDDAGGEACGIGFTLLPGKGGCRGEGGVNINSFRRARVGSLDACLQRCRDAGDVCTGVEYTLSTHRSAKRPNCNLQGHTLARSAGLQRSRTTCHRKWVLPCD